MLLVARTFHTFIDYSVGNAIGIKFVCFLSFNNEERNCSSYARRLNSGKITTFRGYPFLMLSFEGNLFTQGHEIWSQQTRDSTLSRGRNPESLFQLGLNRYRVVTDRRTDGQTDIITIANTRLALRAVARKNLIACQLNRDTV